MFKPQSEDFFLHVKELSDWITDPVSQFGWEERLYETLKTIILSTRPEFESVSFRWRASVMGVIELLKGINR